MDSINISIINIISIITYISGIIIITIISISTITYPQHMPVSWLLQANLTARHPPEPNSKHNISPSPNTAPRVQQPHNSRNTAPHGATRCKIRTTAVIRSYSTGQKLGSI